MKHSKKYIISSFLVGASFVFLNIPCFSVSAIEISVGEQAGIDDYFSAYGENEVLIEINYRADEDGNRDVHLAIMGFQRAALAEQTKIYDQLDFSIAPSTVSVSGSANVGTYKYNGLQYPVTVYKYPRGYNITIENTASFPVASSPHFNLVLYLNGNNVKWTMSDPRYGWFTSTIDGNEPWSGTYTTTGGGSICPDNSANIMMFSSVGISWRESMADYVPTMDSVESTSEYISCMGNVNEYFGGLGVSVNLPESDVDTEKPWDYYNNVLLPYIETNYGDVVDYRDFLVFPDGYEPPAQPSTVPVEYPTSPTFDLGLIEDGTQPTGAETANYELPQFETKTVGVPVFDLSSLNPTQIVAPVSRGLSGIWALITDVLNSFGLFPLVTLSLLVSVIGCLLLLGK